MIATPRSLRLLLLLENSNPKSPFSTWLLSHTPQDKTQKELKGVLVARKGRGLTFSDVLPKQF